MRGAGAYVVDSEVLEEIVGLIRRRLWIEVLFPGQSDVVARLGQ